MSTSVLPTSNFSTLDQWIEPPRAPETFLSPPNSKVNIKNLPTDLFDPTMDPKYKNEVAEIMESGRKTRPRKLSAKAAEAAAAVAEAAAMSKKTKRENTADDDDEEKCGSSNNKRRKVSPKARIKPPSPVSSISTLTSPSLSPSSSSASTSNPNSTSTSPTLPFSQPSPPTALKPISPSISSSAQTTSAQSSGLHLPIHNHDYDYGYSLDYPSNHDPNDHLAVAIHEVHREIILRMRAARVRDGNRGNGLVGRWSLK